MVRFGVSRLFFVSDSAADRRGGWFAQLREGTALGPFLDRQAAKAGLDDYLYGARVNRVEVW